MTINQKILDNLEKHKLSHIKCETCKEIVNIVNFIDGTKSYSCCYRCEGVSINRLYNRIVISKKISDYQLIMILYRNGLTQLLLIDNMHETILKSDNMIFSSLFNTEDILNELETIITFS